MGRVGVGKGGVLGVVWWACGVAVLRWYVGAFRLLGVGLVWAGWFSGLSGLCGLVVAWLGVGWCVVYCLSSIWCSLLSVCKCLWFGFIVLVCVCSLCAFGCFLVFLGDPLHFVPRHALRYISRRGREDVAAIVIAYPSNKRLITTMFGG